MAYCTNFRSSKQKIRRGREDSFPNTRALSPLLLMRSMKIQLASFRLVVRRRFGMFVIDGSKELFLQFVSAYA